MALDVYVGSFTRYYLGNWETPGAKVARDLGASYHVIRPLNEMEGAVTDPAIVQEAVLNWRTSLETGLKKHLPDGLLWSEEPETPYFTDRPAYDGYSSLVLLAAHTECPDFPAPAEAVSEWQTDEAFKVATSPEFKSRFPSLYEVEIWLPCQFSFKFKAPDVAGETVWFGSSVTLYEQLRCLYDEQTNRGHFETAPVNSFDRMARFGLEMFLRLARLSVEHQLPMKLDY